VQMAGCSARMLDAVNATLGPKPSPG
jgi:hypothetical protein